MKKPIISFLFVLGFFFQLPAQDTLYLSFKEAVDIAINQNLNFRQLNNQQEVLKKERQAAQMAHLPNLNMSNSIQSQTGQQFQQVEGELIVTNVTNNIIISGINTSVPVFNGGRRIFETQAGRLQERAGEKGLERATEDVTFEVAQQYLQVLLDEELFKIALENLENQKKQLEQIEGFVQAGLRTLADQYNQQSEVARLETVALNAKIQWENDAWAFAELLQLDLNLFPILEPVNLDSFESEWLNRGLDELYSVASENRKDLQQQDLLEMATRKQIASAKSFLYPQVNAFFNYSTFFTSLDERRISEQLFRVYPQSTIGLSLNIPIFNNFQNKLQITRSKIEHENQILEKKALNRRVFQEIKLAYENYHASIKRESATGTQLMAAEEAQMAISERFRLGISNFVDLAQANQQLVTAQADYAQAKYTLYFQELILQYQLGILGESL